MGRQDGGVVQYSKLVSNGPNSSRYNIVLVSEGYRQDATLDEIETYRSQCLAFVRALYWTQPFHDSWSAINIHRLDVRSTDSGIDDPLTCADGTTGSGNKVATYFDSATCGYGVRRVPQIDSWLVEDTVRAFVPNYTTILVLINNGLGVGAGGSVAKFSSEPGWEKVAIHELGHMFGLADEYECYACNGTDDNRTWGGFLWLEPWEVNITAHNTRVGLKWEDLVLPSTPCPTPPSVSAGTVGLFEGGGYYSRGLFRPEHSCTMRDLSPRFCAVCSRAIELKLRSYLPATPSLVLPAPVPASLMVSAKILGKTMLPGPKGGYRVKLEMQTNLKGTVSYMYRVYGLSLWSLPTTWPVIQVPIELSSSNPYAYNVLVKGTVDKADLDYWVPDDSLYTSAQGMAGIVFPRPSLSAGSISPDFDAPDSLVESQTVSVFPHWQGGSIGTSVTNYYAQLEVELELLDAGFFSPSDNPSWPLQNVVWTPRPFTQNGSRAVFRFGRRGDWCWILPEDGMGIVSEGFVQQGLPIRAQGLDAIGQAFDVTQHLFTTRISFHESRSFFTIPRIPKIEWPMQFERKNDRATKVVEVNGVKVSLKGYTLTIGDTKVQLLPPPIKQAGPSQSFG